MRKKQQENKANANAMGSYTMQHEKLPPPKFFFFDFVFPNCKRILHTALSAVVAILVLMAIGTAVPSTET
jgi:hypothetical protein